MDLFGRTRERDHGDGRHRGGGGRGGPSVEWGERPLACVVAHHGVDVTADDVRTHLRGRVAKWWIPEDVVFLDTLPKTATGKFAKAVLRTSLTRSSDAR